jgi:diguanylate cyclase (GGDEF)-like protein
MNVLLVNSTKSAYDAVNDSIRKEGYRLQVSEGVENIAAEIIKNNARIVIINWPKKEDNISFLINAIKKIKSKHYLYILVIADRIRKNEVLNMMNSGADDCIFKPFSKEDISLKIQMARRIMKLEDSHHKTKKKILKLAKEDPLTGVLNRRALLDESLKEMRRASRKMNFVSAVLIAISNYDEIVEEQGNLPANAMLFEFAKKLYKTCRPYDKLGRFSDTEFLLILPDAEAAVGEIVAQRIHEEMKIPIELNNLEMDVKVYIGISELDPDDIAKKNGPDDNLMNDVLLDSLIRRSELALKKAIENDKEMVVYTF